MNVHKLNVFSHTVYMNWGTLDSQCTIMPISKQQGVTLSKKWSNCFPQIYQGSLPTKQLLWGYFFFLSLPSSTFFSIFILLHVFSPLFSFRRYWGKRLNIIVMTWMAEKILQLFFWWFISFNRKFGTTSYFS